MLELSVYWLFGFIINNRKCRFYKRLHIMWPWQIVPIIILRTHRMMFYLRLQRLLTFSGVFYGVTLMNSFFVIWNSRLIELHVQFHKFYLRTIQHSVRLNLVSPPLTTLTTKKICVTLLHSTDLRLALPPIWKWWSYNERFSRN